MEKDKAIEIIESISFVTQTISIGFLIHTTPRILRTLCTSASMRYEIDMTQDLVYQPFYADFGPLSLGKTWKYITELEKLLNQETLKKTHLYHYTSTDSAKCANAAYLMGAFQVLSAVN
jgi:hypothetical protein